MWNSLYNVLNDAIHSKRVWTAGLAIISLIGSAFFPQRVELVLGVAGIVMALILGDSARPISKTKSESLLVILCGFLLCSSAIAQESDFRPHPVRTYSDGLNVAKAERKPLLVFITQKVCPSCKPARAILDDMRFADELENCIVSTADATTTEGRALMIGKKFTPQIVLFDLRSIESDGSVAKHGIEKVDKPMIVKLLDKLKPQAKPNP